jgi:hypothetical protein
VTSTPEDPNQADPADNESEDREPRAKPPRDNDSRESDPMGDDLFDPDSIEESLTEALNDLEKILDGDSDPSNSNAEIITTPKINTNDIEIQDDIEQYTIPLLKDVVIPGIDIPTQAEHFDPDVEDSEPELLDHDAMMAQLTGSVTQDRQPTFDSSELDEDGHRRRMAERLANEIEVIVQARMEEAIQNASLEIREQVRNHLDIILPEIVDDMLQHRQDPGDKS